MLPNAVHIVINGFFPSLTVKNVSKSLLVLKYWQFDAVYEKSLRIHSRIVGKEIQSANRFIIVLNSQPNIPKFFLRLTSLS